MATTNSSPSTTPELASDTEGSWTSSIVWKSFEIQERERFARLKQDQCREQRPVKEESPPSSFDQYIECRIASIEDEIKRLKSRIAAKENRRRTQKELTPQISLVFGGKDLSTATRLLAMSIPPLTVRDILRSEEYGDDLEFKIKAELYLGASLLEEL